MSLGTTISRKDYTLTGGVTVFPFPYLFNLDSDLVITYTTTAGLETTLVLNVGYTVTGSGTTSGSITTATTYTSGTLTIRRLVSLTQDVVLSNQGVFYSSVHEAEFDKLTMIDQQQQEQLDRAFIAPVSVTSLDLPTPTPGYMLGWNGTGTGLSNFVTGTGTGTALQADLASTASTALGDALVGVKSALTGGVARTQHGKNAEVVSVLDFGAVGDGDSAKAAANTAAMIAAHATGKLIYYPAGEYRVNGKISFSAGGIVGDGKNLTYIVSTDTSTDDIFEFTGTGALSVKGVQIQRITGSAKTTGAGVNVLASVGGDSAYAIFDDCSFYDLPTGVTFTRARLWKVIACNFIGCLTTGLDVSNTYNEDAGDSVVIGCSFSSDLTTGAGIIQHSSGGLKITGNKFNGMGVGYQLAYYSNVAITTNLIIAGNSFEGQVTSLSFDRITGTGTFGNINITGNQFAISTYNISVADDVDFLYDMSITGNVFNIGNNGICIALSRVTNATISGNVFEGADFGSAGRTSTAAISAANCANIKVGTNTYAGMTSVSGPVQFYTSTYSLTKDSQQGSSTVSATGWAGALWVSPFYLSPITTVTYPVAFLVAPEKEDITLMAGATDGVIAGVVLTTSKTAFTYQAFSLVKDAAVIVKWKAWGLVGTA